MTGLFSARSATMKSRGRRRYFRPQLEGLEERVVMDVGGLSSLGLTAATAIVMDNAGNVVGDLGPDTERAMASTTKIMTVMYAIETAGTQELGLSDIVHIGEYARIAGGSGVRAFQTGQQFVLEDLLYVAMLPSDNDAAQAIAEHVALNTSLGRQYIVEATIEFNDNNTPQMDVNEILDANSSFNVESGVILNKAFVRLMNQRAGQLGLTHTHYMNPHGRDPVQHPEQGYDEGPNNGHYSSATDLAKLSRFAMQNQTFAEIAGTDYKDVTSTLPDGTAHGYALSSSVGIMPGRTNAYPGATGVKGGGTGQAGTVLVSQATILGRTLNGVVMDSDDYKRDDDTHLILNYGFEHAYGFVVDAAANAVTTRTSDYSFATRVLTVKGTDANDSIDIYRFANEMWIAVNGIAEFLPIADIGQIVVDARGGNDHITISGLPDELAAGMLVETGVGRDTVQLGTSVGLASFDAPVTVIGTSGDDDQVIVNDHGSGTGQYFTIAGDELQRNGETILRHNSVDMLRVIGTDYNDAFVVEQNPTNAAVVIDGGNGANALAIHGTDAYDTHVVNADSLESSGVNYIFANIEQLVVDVLDGGSTTTINAFPDVAGFTVRGGAHDAFQINTVNDPIGDVLFDAAVGRGASIHAANRVNVWDVTGQGVGTLNGGIEFRGVGDLFGNDGVDTFDFAVNGHVVGIHGGGGHDRLTLNGQESYSDNVVINGNHVDLGPFGHDFEAIESLRIELHGGDSTTTIEAFPADTTLRLHGGVGQDSLTVNRGDSGDTLFVDGERFELNDRNHYFFDLDDLQVNLGDAGSTVAVGYSFTDRLEINGGSGSDEFVLLADDPGGNVTLNGNGGDDAFYTIGLNAESRAGDVALIGGEGDDTFFFNGAGTVAGAIDGGTGQDALDFSAADSAARVTMLTPTALQTDRVVGGASNIDRVIGSAYSDTLVGPDDSPAFSWIISRHNGGYTADWREYAPFHFDGIENLTGGASQDLFRFYYSATISGSIDGGAGRKDWLRYRNYNSGAAVDLTAGTATGVRESVVNIERVIGSEHDDFIRGDEHDNYLSGYNGGNDIVLGMAGNDTLYGTNGRGIIVGGGGADHVNAHADEEYMIIGGATHYDTSNHAEVLFSSLRDVWSRTDLTHQERLEAVDSGMTVLVTAGNTFSYVTVALNDQTITDDDAVDTLHGPNHAMTWSVTGADSGSLSNATGETTSAFAGIEDLIGHAADDQFLFRDNGTLSGRIDGGGGDDRLNYYADHRDVSVTILSGSSFSATGVGGGVSHVEGVVGSQTGNDTLVGPDDSPLFSWMITGQNSGYVADWRDYQPFSFSSIENLTGGASQDLFRFHYSAAISGEIDGGESNKDELRYRRYDTGVNVDLTHGAATGVGRVMNIERVLGTLHDDFIRGDGASNLLNGYHGGDDIILGMGGNDQIYGGSGRNILLGGEGDDSIHGGGAEDILIAGSTIYDTYADADAIFAAIRQAWTGGGSFEDRIETIRNGFSVAVPDEDDDVATLFIALNGNTVSDESDNDQLHDASGRDWYFASLAEALDFDSADDWLD